MTKTTRTFARACAAMVFGLAMLTGCGSDTKPSGDSSTVFGDGGSKIDTAQGVDTAGDSATLELPEDTSKPELKPCEFAGAWGCACETAGDCDSSFCVESSDGKVCSKLCVDTCPDNWKCVQSSATDSAFICLPKYTTLCQPCSEHANCGTLGATGGEAKCIPLQPEPGFTNGSFCGSPCNGTADCPDNFDCSPINLPGEPTVTQCVPSTNECTCSKAAVGNALKTSCERTNEFGSCKGARTCTTDGLTLCGAPAPVVEVCDGEDNDCDGVTDEDGALGCKVFYPDQDNDGAGIGQGDCRCSNPGPGYSTNGGDCDDTKNSIGPTAKEICNDLDDNCNGSTDEPGASGCSVYYLDKDADGFGDPDDAACLCKSSKTQDYVDTAGDCNDQSDKIKPGVPELCDDQDNNCDGKTDEENAQGCTLHYLDIDKDGFGPTETGVCICKPDAIYPVDKPGDCDDSNPKLNPSVNEACNNLDDDCNGTTDDGDAAKSCPLVAGITPACNAGVCGVASCPPNAFDIDGKFENGCECNADGNYGKTGGTCAAAVDLGPLGDGGTTAKIKGNLMPGESADWYKAEAFDGPDTGDCDTFSVRARLVQGADTFVLDLYRGSCAGKAQICEGETDTAWTVAFGGKPNFGPFTEKGSKAGKVVASPEPFPGGECKCTKTAAPDGPGLPGMNLCTDNSAWFYIAVRYKPNQAPVCAFYELELTNGIYKP